MPRLSCPRALVRVPVLVIALLAAAGAPWLAAQAVRGRLVDKVNGAAIGGAFVVLLNTQGDEVARALTSAEGTFVVRAPGPGTYVLQSKRIGFRMSASPPIQLAAGQTLAYRLEVEEVPVELPPVVVTGKPRCGTRGDAGTAVAQLWEDTREALTAVRWTLRQGSHRYTLDMYERDLDADAHHVQHERAWTKTGRSAVPFASLPAESLAVVGYVVGDVLAGETFYAPDADALLSDAFLETHCFTAREGEGGDSGYVGLVFEPAPQHDRPDIRGVLWVSRRTGELKDLKYDYVHLPRGVPRGAPGGEVDFMRLESGAWIVLRWVIRMPRMGQLVDESRHTEPIFKVIGYRETGGEVRAIRSARGELEYSARQAYLDGTVVDSFSFGRPLAAATVSLVGTPYKTQTDSLGRFELAGPIEGTFGLSFSHPRLDSLGVHLTPERVTLQRGKHTRAELVLPSESRVTATLCPDGLPDSERVIVGTVRDEQSNAPVPGAVVEASWESVQQIGGGLTVQPLTVRVTADSAGGYAICNVPPKRVALHATAGGATSRTTVLSFTVDGVWIDQQEFKSAYGQVWTEILTISH